jgi:hypothetical protein
MGARHWGGIGFSYRPARLHRLAEFTPWNPFRGPIHFQKYQLWKEEIPKNRIEYNRIESFIFSSDNQIDTAHIIHKRMTTRAIISAGYSHTQYRAMLTWIHRTEGQWLIANVASDTCAIGGGKDSRMWAKVQVLFRVPVSLSPNSIFTFGDKF